MGERVKENGKFVQITREPGYLYFTRGDPIGIYRTKMQHKGRKKSEQPSKLVKKTTVTRKQGYLYYIDSAGYLSRAKMRRGRKR